MTVHVLLATIGKRLREMRGDRWRYVRCLGCGCSVLIETVPRDGWTCGACGRPLQTTEPS